MKKLSKWCYGFIVVLVMFLFVGCSENFDNSAEKIQAEQTQQLLTDANNQIGMPNIKNFQQKKLMKLIYELCDQENLMCYAYIKSDYQGKLVYLGECIGYGIPFSAQYTNPEQIKTYYSQGVAAISTPQADPNGLYMPTSSSATWLMMVDPKTQKPRPVYIEPEIVVSPFPLHEIK